MHHLLDIAVPITLHPTEINYISKLYTKWQAGTLLECPAGFVIKKGQYVNFYLLSKVALSAGTAVQHQFFSYKNQLYAIGNPEEDAELGRGQFGRVMIGKKINSQQQLAVKVIEPNTRFDSTEIKALYDMGLCFGHGFVNGQHIITMPLLEGKSLQRVTNKFQIKDRLKLALATAGN